MDVLSHIREKAALRREEILSAHVHTSGEMPLPIKGASPKTALAVKGKMRCVLTLLSVLDVTGI